MPHYLNRQFSFKNLAINLYFLQFFSDSGLLAVNSVNYRGVRHPDLPPDYDWYVKVIYVVVIEGEGEVNVK